MEPRTVRKYIVSLGTKHETFFVNCRTEQGGITCLRRLYPMAGGIRFMYAGDSFACNYRSDEMDELKS